MPANKRFSAAKKLAQAAALAAVLVPLGSVAADASILGPFNYGIGGSGLGSDHVFDFHPSGLYSFELEFFGLTADFLPVTVEDIATNQTTLFGPSGRLYGIGGRCVEINPGDSLNPCVDFVVTLVEPDPRPWDHYDVRIAWDEPTDADFPGSLIRILHTRDDGSTADITLLGSYCSTSCEEDPFLDGRDTRFSSTFTLAQVPEPGTVLLVASGLIGLYHRRRRSRSTDASPRS